jgi:tetratricopeptide (TPR) repeat protein
VNRLAAVAACAALGVATPAFADDAARARAADRSARAHYDAHEYDAAIADYQTAYRAMPDPLFLFDIAQSYRKLDDCDHALQFYREYLQARPSADNRDQVERFIDKMTACAMPEPEWGASATATDRPPVQPVVAAPPPSPLSNHTLRLAGISSAALGVVLLGAAVYFSNQAGALAQQLETACAHGCSGASVHGIDEAGRIDDHDAIALYAIGGTALAAGATVIVWTWLRAPGEAPVIAPTQGGATVSARLKF